MFYISKIYTTSPNKFKTNLQQRVYETLNELSIQYERVETDEAITMEDCIEINNKLNMKMVKTLFLCNRQQTSFYLYITTGNKKFNSKEFSNKLQISRVSFAKTELMDKMLETKVGAATIFSTLIDKENNIQIVIDKDVLNEEFYGCSDGTTTGYMKIKTSDIINKVLPYTKHKEIIIEI